MFIPGMHICRKSTQKACKKTREEDVILVWSRNESLGYYSTKLGYEDNFSLSLHKLDGGGINCVR
jgi:hypothetical protein